VTNIVDEVNCYLDTVNAIISLAAITMHDGRGFVPNSRFGIGRRMTTSDRNKVQPSTDVTPDVVIQKFEDYGVVAEVKRSMCDDLTRWNDVVMQLVKYDDELKGWWTSDESVVKTNVLLLLHQSRSRKFLEYYRAVVSEERPDPVSDSICIVEFNQSNESQQYYHLRLEHGRIDDEELSRKLQYGVQVPLERVKSSFPNLQYYDSKPPLAFLLAKLWLLSFPSYLSRRVDNPKLGTKTIPLDVTEVTTEMQRSYGSGALEQDERSAEFPRESWIREAFEALVRLGYAYPEDQERQKYSVAFRPIKNDVITHFAERLSKGLQRETMKSDSQMELFPS
jgi:hypothetical protein